MKILILTETLNVRRGYGRFAYDLILNLRAARADAQIKALTMRGEERYLDETPALFPGKWLGIFLNPLIIFWHAMHADVVHALDGYPFAVYAAPALLFLPRKRFVITLQGTYAVEPLYSWKRKLLLWAYNRATRVTAISNFTKNEVLKIAPRLEIKVINHGVSCVALPAGGGESVFGKYILSVGAVTERKGYRTALAAFAKIAREFQYINYVIFGKQQPGDYLDEIKKIISDEGLTSRVIFPDDLSDKAKFSALQNALIFLLPSINVGHHFEGFGLVYLEAGCFGLPVVGASGSGAEDAIQDGVTGFLAPQNNADKTADALRKLLGDDSLRQKMGEANRQFAAEHTWISVAKGYLTQYTAK